MKKKMRIVLPLLLAALFLLPLAPRAAAEEEAWSTDVDAIPFAGNVNAHYVITGGIHDPGYSFLFANEAGGVTVVQSVLKADRSNAEEGLLVAEFSGELEPLRWRTLPLPNVEKWCGFLNGTDYYYVFYSAGGGDLSIDQYEKDWTLKQRRIHGFNNTAAFPHNDFDVCQAGDRIVIATNHTMSSGSAWGHEANLRLELDAETLQSYVEHSGVSNYGGYASHDYMPEVVYSEGIIYILEQSDGIPREGIVLSTYEGSLTKYKKLLTGPVTRFQDWRNWGGLGNAVAAGGGVLMAMNEGDYVLNDPDGPARCNAWLYYGNGPAGTQTTLQISFEGTVATPIVAAVDESHGYVLWNPEIRSDRDGDEMDYVSWTITDGELSAGEVQTAEKHPLSDCEPISWEGGLLWYTVNGYGELTFYTIGADGSLGQKDFHKFHRWKVLSTKQPTCSEEGYREQRCLVCGLEETESIPALGHNMDFREGYAATCLSKGKLDYYYCWRCNKNFSDEAGTEELEDLYIPALGHDWQEEVLQEADCVTKTDGKLQRTCARCGKVQTETLYYRLVHQLEHIEAKEPTCTEAGWGEYYHCTLCGRMYADEGANREYYYVGHIALGHDMVFVERQEPTALADGHIEHYRCSRCGKPFRDRYGNEPLTEAEIRLPALGSFAALDFDGDGDVDADDAAAILRAVSRGTVRPEMDLSGDGVVSNRDGLRLFRMLPLPQ